MKVAVHPLVDDYVRSLETAARTLPRREREELVAEIRDHLDEALPLEPTEADVRNVLDQLGSPEDIVAAARPDAPAAARPVRRGAREAFAVVLLVTGMPPIVGWLVGAGLLLWSPLWSGRQKLLGVLVWPGGLTSLLFVTSIASSSTACVYSSTSQSNVVTADCGASSGPDTLRLVILALVVLAPIAVGMYLWRAAGRRSAV
jgi:hypothetical protein